VPLFLFLQAASKRPKLPSRLGCLLNTARRQTVVHLTLKKSLRTHDRGIRELKSGFRFFGIEIARKTDILAAAAFVISITGLCYQLYGFAASPTIVQFPPEQLIFFPEKSGNGIYVHSGAQVTYVNKGREGKTAVVKLQRMVFDLQGKTYELKWQFFDNFSNAGNQLVRLEKPEPAVPIVIKAGEAVTKETHFSPRTLLVVSKADLTSAYKNFLPWDEFVSELEKLKELDVRIISEFYGLKEKETKVFIRVTPALITALKTDKWDAPSCWER
jgi:hypothetical protein